VAVSSFTAPLHVEVMDSERSGQGLFRVLKAFTYEVRHLGSGELVTVPEGFETDFCSLPTPARAVLPIAGRSAKAALLHDWLLMQRDNRAHDVFSEALKVAKVAAWKRWIMVTAVRLWAV
jgi:hypothetical protein